MSDLVQTRSEGGARVVLLNRPDHRNALTSEMLDELAGAVDSAGQDTGARVVVLRGAGKHFCTGLDLDEFYASAAAPPAEHRRDAERLARILSGLVRLPQPTIAVVQGKALGVGATLAIACDLVVASSSSILAFPEVSYGFVPAFGVTLLRRLAGDKVAFELTATGRPVVGEEALRLGLVSRVIPDEGFDAVTGSTLRGLCVCAAATLSAVKEAFLATEGKPLDEALAISAELNARARASEPFREAARQFLAMS